MMASISSLKFESELMQKSSMEFDVDVGEDYNPFIPMVYFG